MTDQQSRLPSTAAEPERPAAPWPPHACRLWDLRLVRFGTVAVSCTLLQLAILVGLAHLGLNQVIANGIGFALSAQLNFVLSARLTWRDRELRPSADPRARMLTWAARWAAFNTIAVAALVANELIFATATHHGVWIVAASLLGIVTGAAVTFTANNLITFRRGPVPAGQGADAEHRPALHEIRTRVREDGVAFFLPAFNEAANLRTIVPRTVGYFQRLDCPFTVTIVDDGSTRDDTFETAEQLAHAVLYGHALATEAELTSLVSRSCPIWPSRPRWPAIRSSKPPAIFVMRAGCRTFPWTRWRRISTATSGASSMRRSTGVSRYPRCGTSAAAPIWAPSSSGIG